MNKEKDYFIENLAMLISSGMDILTAIDSIASEVKSRGMKKSIKHIRDAIDAGSPLSSAFQDIKLFPKHIISLVSIGEKSGRLAENLNMIALQTQKDREFRSKVRSAMLYPVFVLVLAALVAIGVSWFLLPRLTSVFTSLNVELPVLTRGLIYTGNFFSSYGLRIVPVASFLFLLLLYFGFLFPRTQFIGQYILFRTPGIKQLLLEIELARMGSLLGALINAGLPIVDAIKSLADATTFRVYKNFYAVLGAQVEDGNSIMKSMVAYSGSKQLIPLPIQQMIAVGEKSGELSSLLLRIGQNYEARMEVTTKNLSVVIEPILLIIVWIGVLFVALAVILPIYKLIGGIH